MWRCPHANASCLSQEWCDTVLCATGRDPSLSNLGLPQAGVEVDERGIVVGRGDETSVPHIFAVGDTRPDVRVHGGGATHTSPRHKHWVPAIESIPTTISPLSLPETLPSHSCGH